MIDSRDFQRAALFSFRDRKHGCTHSVLKMASEADYAVIKFFSDGKYSTCSKQNKVKDEVGLFVVGHEVSIQWTLKKVERGVVVFVDGKSTIYYFKRVQHFSETIIS